MKLFATTTTTLTIRIKSFPILTMIWMLSLPIACMGLSSQTLVKPKSSSILSTKSVTAAVDTASPPRSQRLRQYQEEGDVLFHECCELMGIEMPYASVRTTKESVAGRGVFCDLRERGVDGDAADKKGISSRSDGLILPQGTTMIRIPASAVFCSPTASKLFPDTATNLNDRLQKIQKQQEERKRDSGKLRSLMRLLKRPFRRWNRTSGKADDDDKRSKLQSFEEIMEFADESDYWQIELTVYALRCLQHIVDDRRDDKGCSENNHSPWATWISQWQRHDPVQRLYEQSVMYNNMDAIEKCVDQLHQLLPDADRLKIFAAVDIRLRRLHALKNIFSVSDVAGLSSMYGLVTSRAIELGGDEPSNNFAAVIPAFDMINHSPNPNLCFSYDEETDYFELVAQRDIADGEELFLSYTRPGSGTYDGADNWNEESAIWTLVQWGIPEGRRNI